MTAYKIFQQPGQKKEEIAGLYMAKQGFTKLTSLETTGKATKPRQPF